MLFAGEFGFGSLKSDCMEVSIADTSYVGDHRFWSISKQIPPSAYTFGWNIFDWNRTEGGLFGYSSVNSIVSLNVPSSNGVSWGPKMIAFQTMILLSVGAPETPDGGSSCNLLKSRIKRRRDGVDMTTQIVFIYLVREKNDLADLNLTPSELNFGLSVEAVKTTKQ